MRAIVRLAAFSVLLGCSAISGSGDEPPREAGPHADEAGAVTYWKVTNSSMTAPNCTDEDGFVSAPEFAENSYLMYKLSEDLASAQGQSCDTTAASSCTDSALSYTVNGDMLTYQAPDKAIEGNDDCSYSMQTTWTVSDYGEVGKLEVLMAFVPVPDAEACEAFDQVIAENASNGKGLIGCEVVLDVDLAFEKAQFP